MQDIAYKNYKKNNDIHGTVLYPAVMVAPVQKQILKSILKKEKSVRLFDPFHGSGTALYEAAEVSNNINMFGCDINPLANLITKVKLQGVSKDIVSDIKLLKKILLTDFEFNIHDFPNIHKWFRDDIIIDLSKIRESIMKISDTNNRLFFWCMMSDIVRKYSNTRSSTYKLHIKKTEDILKMQNNLIHDYIDSININYKKFTKHYTNFSLVKGDTLSCLNNIESNSFDICITSPPYGDNATTVTYGQFSILPLYWINPNDLQLEGWELNNYSIIDSKSLGGTLQTVKGSDFIPSELVPYIQAISEHKQKKVIRFFTEYYKILDQIVRVTKTYIIMTLGNRTVDGIKINLTGITINYLSKKGFAKIDIAKRNILSKRIPKKISIINNKTVYSMNEEYVVVMEKKNN